MISKQGISEKEFDKLTHLLSKRKKQNQGLLTITVVRETLSEVGLIDYFTDEDLEIVRNQINEEFQKRKSRRSRLFTLAVGTILTPTFVFSGYKLKELRLITGGLDPTPQGQLLARLENQENQIKSLETENKLLQSREKDLKADNEELKQTVSDLIKNIGKAETPENNGEEEKSVDIVDSEDENSQNSTINQTTTKDTTPGTLLKEGQTWYQNGMEMTVTEVSFNPGCDEGFVQFDVSIANHSGKDLETDIAGIDFYVTIADKPYSNFSWTTNLAARSNCKTYSSAKYYNNYLVPSKGFSIPELKSKQEEEYYLVFWGDLYDFSQEIIFHVKKAGTIESAKWKLEPEQQ